MILSESYKKRLSELAGIINEADNRKVIVDKIGLSQEMADWTHNISEKYSIWIANQIKKFNLDKASESDFRKILDWKKVNQEVNLNKFDFESALNTSNQWHQEQFKVQDIKLRNKDVFLKTGPYFWVQLTTKEDCAEEGLSMGHCIGGDGHAPRIADGTYKAFSMRDSNNQPHITIEIDPKGRIIEFKGKENKIPNEKYLPYAFEFLLKEINLWTEITDKTFFNFLSNSFKLLPDDIKSIYSSYIEKFIKNGKKFDLSNPSIFKILSETTQENYAFLRAKENHIIPYSLFELMNIKSQQEYLGFILKLVENGDLIYIEEYNFRLFSDKQKLKYIFLLLKRNIRISHDFYVNMNEETKEKYIRLIYKFIEKGKFFELSDEQFKSLNPKERLKYALLGSKFNKNISFNQLQLLDPISRREYALKSAPIPFEDFSEKNGSFSEKKFELLDLKTQKEYVSIISKRVARLTDEQFGLLSTEEQKNYFLLSLENKFSLSKNKFELLNTELKRLYSVTKTEKNFDVEDEEFKLLDNEHKKKDIFNKLEKGQGISDFIFNSLTPEVKDEYIKRYSKKGWSLEIDRFMSLSDEQREYYAVSLASNTKKIDNEKFNLLTYEAKVNYALTFAKSTLKQQYLRYENIPKEQLESLPSKVQKEYENTKNRISI